MRGKAGKRIRRNNSIPISLGGCPRMAEDNAIHALDIRLQGAFTCTAAPVQAEGKIGEHAFYFRARHDSWSFAVALRSDVDPAHINFRHQGFIREGSYGSAQ